MVVSNLVCPMCLEGEETSQHLFFACRLAQGVWNACDRWVGVKSARHVSSIMHLQSFHLNEINARSNIVWKGMWA